MCVINLSAILHSTGKTTTFIREMRKHTQIDWLFAADSSQILSVANFFFFLSFLGSSFTHCRSLAEFPAVLAP